MTIEAFSNVENFTVQLYTFMPQISQSSVLSDYLLLFFHTWFLSLIFYLKFRTVLCYPHSSSLTSVVYQADATTKILLVFPHFSFRLGMQALNKTKVYNHFLQLKLCLHCTVDPVDRDETMKQKFHISLINSYMFCKIVR